MQCKVGYHASRKSGAPCLSGSFAAEFAVHSLSAFPPIATKLRTSREVRFVAPNRNQLARDTTARSHDLFCTAHLGVVATDDPFDLSSRTATIVHEQDLAFTHRSHGRFLLHGCRKCRTGNTRYEKPGNKSDRLDHFSSPVAPPDNIARENRSKGDQLCASAQFQAMICGTFRVMNRLAASERFC